MKRNGIIAIILLLVTLQARAQNIGMHTTAPLAKLHVDLGSSLANGVLFTGTESSSGGTFPSLGAGNRFMYYPMKVVFRAGYVDGAQWDNANVGSYSFAFGYNPIAKGNASTAIGDAVYAGGTISTAFGNSTMTRGYSSFVLGMYNDPILTADQDFEIPLTPLFMVGNGDGGATRNNALTVFKNGAVLMKNYATVLVDPGVKVPPVTGPGTRMMWMPEKSALRIGTVHNDDWNADSIGTWSTGIGYSTSAKGQFSLAMGLHTTASGLTATALGYNTTASGENSISMGSVTTASGANTTSLGFLTTAKSYGSIAMGRYNDRISTSDSLTWIPTDPLLIVGNGTSAGALHNTMVIYKNGNIISKNPTLVNVNPGIIPLPVNGPGTRMMWIPEKGALRAGTVDNTNWDADSLGSWSTGLGFSTKAKGPVSFAAGFGSAATGVTSTAFGYSTVASGENATAMGSVSTASGPVATALGFSTTASGFSSVAMGSNTKASGINSASLGYSTQTKSYASVAIGRFNDKIATSDSAAWTPTDPLFMLGNGTADATPHNAMVVYKNGNMVLKNPMPFFYEKLPAEYEVPVEGEGTRMMWLPELGAFRVGSAIDSAWNTNKIGLGSFAAGVNATASGLITMAAGLDTKAAGALSTAIGYGNIANGYSSTVIGMFNNPILPIAEAEWTETESPLFIVGNGNDFTDRQNAMVVRKDGNVGIGTDVPGSRLHINGAIKIVDGTQAAGKVLTSDAAGLASWQSPPPPPAEPVAVQSVTICCQSWMTKNLDVSTYRNGDIIPHVTSNAAWAALTTGAYCYFNNDSATYAAVYGKLYNWYAVNDPRGLAPEGWHVPTAFELMTVIECLGVDPGGKLKERGTSHWSPPNLGATNLSGFTALPGGLRLDVGTFGVQGVEGPIWGATDYDAVEAYYLSTGSGSANSTVNHFKMKSGFTVRCIRD